MVRVGGADDARARPGRVADRGAAQPARRGGAARRVVARAGPGASDRVRSRWPTRSPSPTSSSTSSGRCSSRAPAAELVHATANGPSMLVGLTAKWQAGTPVLLSEHGVYLRERLLAVRREGHGRGRCGRCSCGSSTGSPSSATAGRRRAAGQRLQRPLGGARRRAAPTGSARCTTASTPRLPLLDDEPAEPTLVFAGRIDPLKDLATLVRAVALVRGQVPGARLRLFGGVPAGNEGYADGDPAARRRARPRRGRSPSRARSPRCRARSPPARSSSCPACPRGCR